jgi:hypothetical protein
MPRFPVQLYLKDINPNLPAPWGSHPQNRFGLKEIKLLIQFCLVYLPAPWGSHPQYRPGLKENKLFFLICFVFAGTLGE